MDNLDLYLTFALTWWTLIAVFTGVGLLVYRLFGLKVRRVETVFLAFWTGWALSIAVLQLWHFFFPVNDGIRLLLSSAGLIGLGLNWQYILQTLWGKIRRYPLWFVFAFLFMVWLINRSIAETANVDTGLYHLDVVRWSSEYRIVPGLANLHSRLGFSTGFFLYGALLNTGYWYGHVHNIANQVLYLVMVCQLSLSLFYVFRKTGTESYHYVAALLLPVVIHALFFPTDVVPTLSNDGAVYLAGIIVVLQLLRLINQPELDAKEGKIRLGLVILIAAIGITAKYSFIVPGVGLSLMGIFIWLKRFDRITIKSFLRLAIPLGFVAAFVLIPMVIRSVLFTGYPLYPLTLGAIDVEWRLPAEYAQSENDWIRAWARQPGLHPDIVLANWDWFSIWWPRVRDRPIFQIPINIMLLCICLLAMNRVLTLRRPKQARIDPARWWLLLPLIVGLAYWFYSAPAPRFAGSMPWLIAFIIFVNVIESGVWSTSPWQRRLYMLVYTILLVYPFQEFVNSPWIQPPDTGSAIYAIPEPMTEPYVTDSNLTIFVPPENEFCWGSTLPCTVYPDPSLALRVPNSLQDGFIMKASHDEQ